MARHLCQHLTEADDLLRKLSDLARIGSSAAIAPAAAIVRPWRQDERPAASPRSWARTNLGSGLELCGRGVFGLCWGLSWCCLYFCVAVPAVAVAAAIAAADTPVSSNAPAPWFCSVLLRVVFDALPSVAIWKSSIVNLLPSDTLIVEGDSKGRAMGLK